jgi:hypothetical protein
MLMNNQDLKIQILLNQKFELQQKTLRLQTQIDNIDKKIQRIKFDKSKREQVKDVAAATIHTLKRERIE